MIFNKPITYNIGFTRDRCLSPAATNSNALTSNTPKLDFNSDHL